MPLMGGLLLPLATCSIVTKTIVEGSSSLKLMFLNDDAIFGTSPWSESHLIHAVRLPRNPLLLIDKKILIHFNVHVCPPQGHSSEIEPQEHKVCTKEFVTSAFLGVCIWIATEPSVLAQFIRGIL